MLDRTSADPRPPVVAAIEIRRGDSGLFLLSSGDLPGLYIAEHSLPEALVEAGTCAVALWQSIRDRKTTDTPQAIAQRERWTVLFTPDPYPLAPAASGTEAEKLLPCPFCGQAETVEVRHGVVGYYVICGGDGEDGCWAASARGCPTETDAIRRWNRRPAVDAAHQRGFTEAAEKARDIAATLLIGETEAGNLAYARYVDLAIRDQLLPTVRGPRPGPDAVTVLRAALHAATIEFIGIRQELRRSGAGADDKRVKAIGAILEMLRRADNGEAAPSSAAWPLFGCIVSVPQDPYNPTGAKDERLVIGQPISDASPNTVVLANQALIGDVWAVSAITLTGKVDFDRAMTLRERHVAARPGALKTMRMVK